MRRMAEVRIVLTLLATVLVPTVVAAQSSITGVVRDSSGAVLPGVTVEAASDALIEKVRTAVTDGTGQYRILDLRQGVYTVSFSLTGFNTVKREGLELPADFVSTVNAELRVEGTNLLNRSNFLRVNATYGDGAVPVATFLRPVAGLTNSDPGRQLQLGIRFTF